MKSLGSKRLKEKTRKGASHEVDRCPLVTSHDGCFFLSSLEVLLRQFKIKIEADLLLVQLRKLSPKITRPLQSVREIYQLTETKENHGESYSKTTAESNIQQ